LRRNNALRPSPTKTTASCGSWIFVIADLTFRSQAERT
jgi:hypothetical protein